jgi:outer membrane protein assembly factor BamA
MMRLVTLLVLVGVLSVPALAKKSDEAVQDTSSGSMSFTEVIAWPFIHVIQPFFSSLVYPIAAPLHYAIENGVADKAVDLITFGEKRNIFIYPVFNLKPGSSTMIGLCYRHRNLFYQNDYAVLEGHYYANSDFDVKMRYSKQSLFGKKLYGLVNLNIYMDRDNGFTLPVTKESFKQADTTINAGLRFGFPITESRNLNFSFGSELVYHLADFTDTKDSVLDHPKFPIEDRGLYQGHFEIPFYVNLVFDNLDFPYAPSKGQRLSLSASYVLTSHYSGITADDMSIVGLHRSSALKDGGKNHDYVSVDAFYQIYFFIGRADKYVLSAKEGRKTRKFYTDFSLNEVLRVWRPENLVETLFEHRVFAFQLRFQGMWEMEKGGAPYSAFPSLNARFPLRGYTGAWVAPFVLGLSTEYRWPVDRLVDGVVFNEYAMISDKINSWSKDHLYNSWGFGVRVRKPDMYLFRVQFAFHSWHGLSLILTIAPEFR